MKTCGHCGSALAEDAPACQTCGAVVPLSENPQPPIAQLAEAIAHEDCERVRRLLERDHSLANAILDGPFKQTPLHRAAIAGNSELTGILLAFGAEPNAQNEHGVTPLLYAIVPNRGDAYNVVRALIEHGANSDLADDQGETPLIMAGRAGRADIARLLLEHGANVHAEDLDGYSAMQVAASGSQDERHVETMSVLQEYGARPPVPGYRPPRVQELLEQLERKLAQVLFRAIEAGAVESVRSFVTDHASLVDARDEDWHNRTPLHAAAVGADDPEIVRILLDAGAAVDARDEFGLTPLHLAAGSKAQTGEEIVHILIVHGADTNAADNDGLTPLHFAVAERSAFVVRRLLEEGARPDAVGTIDAESLTPLALAEKIESPAMLAVLRVHGRLS